jgi:hypothetical protein
MTLDIDKIEAILREHWHLPSALGRAKLQEHAGRIQVLVRQKYSHDNLKYQLGLMQTRKLKQELDDLACEKIAAELLKEAG